MLIRCQSSWPNYSVALLNPAQQPNLQRLRHRHRLNRCLPTPPKPRTPPKKTDADAKQKSAQLASQQRQQAQATVKSTQTPSTSQQQKQQVLPKAFTDTAQSNAATRPLPSSTAASLAAQNAVRARSIAQTQRSLYPLAHDEVVKRLTS